MVEVIKPNMERVCNSCNSELDVLEISISYKKSGMTIRLCDDCRDTMLNVLMKEKGYL